MPFKTGGYGERSKKAKENRKATPKVVPRNRSRRPAPAPAGLGSKNIIANRAAFVVTAPGIEGNFFSIVRAEARRIQQVAKSRRWGKPVEKRLGLYMGACVAQNFKQQKDSTGATWPELSPDTLRKRKKKRPLSKSITKVNVDYREWEDRTIGLGRHVPNKKTRTMEGKHQVKVSDVPLIDTGELFSSVSVPVQDGGKYGLSIASTFAHTGERIRLQVRSSGDIYFEPKKMDKDLLLKFAVHNRPVADKKAVGNGARVPGREFFYLRKKDMEFIREALTMWLIIGSNEQQIADRFTRFKSRPISGLAQQLGTFAPSRIEPKRSKISALKSRAKEVASGRSNEYNGVFHGMIAEETERKLSALGVMDFINMTTSIRRSVGRRMAKRKSEST